MTHKKVPNKFKNVDAQTLDEISDMLGDKFDDFVDMIDNIPATAGMSIKKESGKILFKDKNNAEWAELTDVRLDAKGGTNNWNPLLEVTPPLIKNFEYRVDNDFVFKTDGQGRVDKIIAENMKIQKRPRNTTSQQDAKNQKDGLKQDSDGYSDDGGHMIRSQFFGPSEQINYFPQKASVNRAGGDWYKMESDIKKLIEDNPNANIKVEIEAIFGSTNRPKRPTEFKVKIYKDGQKLPDNGINGIGAKGKYDIENPE